MNYSLLHAKPILFKHPQGWDEMSLEQQREIGQDAINNYKAFVYDACIKIRDGSDMKSIKKICGIKT